MTPWTRYVSPAVGVLIALTVVTTLVTAIDAGAGGHLWFHLALIPHQVLEGELWRLVTWPLVERSPVSLILGCLSLHWFGGDLAARWGQARFVRAVATIVLSASLGTTLLSLVLDVGGYPHLGGWALTTSLAITWGLCFTERCVRVWGVFVITARQLAYGLVVFVGLCAVFFGIGRTLPAAIAAAVGLLHAPHSGR